MCGDDLNQEVRHAAQETASVMVAVPRAGSAIAAAGIGNQRARSRESPCLESGIGAGCVGNRHNLLVGKPKGTSHR